MLMLTKENRILWRHPMPGRKTSLKGMTRRLVEMQKLSVSLNNGGSEQKSPALPGVPDR